MSNFGQPPGGGGFGQPPGGAPPAGGGGFGQPPGGGGFGQPPGGAPPPGGGGFGQPPGGPPGSQPGSFGQPPGGPSFGAPGGGGPQTDQLAQISVGVGAAGLLIGLVGCCIPCIGIVSWPLSLAAIGTGIASMVRQNKEPEKYGGKPLAIAGIALGGVWVVLNLIWTILMLTGAIGSSLLENVQ